MNRKLYKAAYKRVLEKKFFYRHLIIFVVGNFVLFFMSLRSWTPAIFYLLTLIWIRVLALHFANAYPEVVRDFGFKNEASEDRAINKEIKKLRKEQKAQKKVAAAKKEADSILPLKPVFADDVSQKYKDSDLV